MLSVLMLKLFAPGRLKLEESLPPATLIPHIIAHNDSIIIFIICVLGVNYYVVLTNKDKIITVEDAMQLNDIDCILVLGAGVYGNQPERQQRLEALGYNYREVQNKVNEMLGGGTKYLSNKSYKGVSIVDALNEISVDSSFSYRSKLASANGISNYTGTAEQNTQLLNLLKNGTLKQA